MRMNNWKEKYFPQALFQLLVASNSQSKTSIFILYSFHCNANYAIAISLSPPRNFMCVSRVSTNVVIIWAKTLICTIMLSHQPWEKNIDMLKSLISGRCIFSLKPMDILLKEGEIDNDKKKKKLLDK